MVKKIARIVYSTELPTWVEQLTLVSMRAPSGLIATLVIAAYMLLVTMRAPSGAGRNPGHRRKNDKSADVGQLEDHERGETEAENVKTRSTVHNVMYNVLTAAINILPKGKRVYESRDALTLPSYLRSPKAHNAGCDRNDETWEQ